MKFFTYLLICIVFVSCYNKERNCNDYKTGAFEFTYIVDGVEKSGRFIRTDSLNIDYYENKIDSASVRWINDCEFIQKTINPKNMAEENAIHFKILSTTDSTYTFEYKLAVKKANQKARVEQGTAKRIK